MKKIVKAVKPVDYILEVAKALDEVKRFGQTKDDPEGARFVILSDTLAKKLS